MADYKILLIDYEPRSIERLRLPLERAGYEVVVAQDGLAGLEEFQRHRPHLVLVEAMLPKKHGFEVCQTLKQTPLGKATPIVIVTSVYKGRKYRSQALHNFGCNEYLEKPIEDEVLLSTVRRLLDGTAASSSVAPAASGAGATATEDDDVLIIDESSAPPLEADEKVLPFDAARRRRRPTAAVMGAKSAASAGHDEAAVASAPAPVTPFGLSESPVLARTPVAEPRRLAVSDPVLPESQPILAGYGPNRRRLWILVGMALALASLLLLVLRSLG